MACASVVMFVYMYVWLCDVTCLFVVVSAEVADRSRKQQLQALNLLVLLLPAVHRNVLQVRRHHRRLPSQIHSKTSCYR